MRAAQTYAYNGLGLQDGMPAAIGARASESVETSREATQNTVNALQQQLTSARSRRSNACLCRPPAESQQ